MGSIPLYSPSSTDEEVEQFLDALAGPLLDRARLVRPALGLAYYDGEQLDSRWPELLAAWVKGRGGFIEHCLVEQLGDEPVRRLLARHRVGEHLFSIELTPRDLPDAALMESTAVADLNIHRDTFRDANLCLLLWIPRSRIRRFLDLASNLADYRTVNLDVPTLADASDSTPATVAPTKRGAQHNLPLLSLGDDFVGRQAELERLREMLAESGRGAIIGPLALEGLGGIGKTRLAIEFAWHSLDDYDRIFFLRADTPETLGSELAGLAAEEWLGLAEAGLADEQARVDAVIRWFADHDRWLLILDNADSEPSADYIADELFPALNRGHVLLTTRYRRWGGDVRNLSLAALPASEAVRWLITGTQGSRRETPDDPEVAQRLADALESLPLALEQIVAWVRARNATLNEALVAITAENDSLLRWYDGDELRYPLPVAAVWEQAFESRSPTEQFLLRLIGWLAPNPVPDFVVSQAEHAWPESDEPKPDFLAVARTLADHSLLNKRTDRSFQLHRLWIELERRRTPPDERRAWDRRVAAVLNAASPTESHDVRNWAKLALLYPHATELFRRSEDVSRECDGEESYVVNLSRLLNVYGVYLRNKAEYAEAEPLMRRALAIDEQSYGAEHPKVAIRLNNLAQLLQATNRMAEAEPLMGRALAIDEQSYGAEHPSVARDLNNLALLLKVTNRLAEAEPLYRRALAIDEQSYGAEHPSVARDLNNLSQLLQATNRLAEAEPLMRRALGIVQDSLGPDHPNTQAVARNLELLLAEKDSK